MSEARAWPPLPLRWPDPPPTDGVVVLDRMTGADVPDIVAGCRDAESQRWLPLPDSYTDADARTFLEMVAEGAVVGAMLTLGARDAASGRLAGSLGLHFQRARECEAEIGYWVAPWARGRGVASRGIRLLARWAFQAYAPRRVELLVQPGNIPSRRAAERAGAGYEGIRRAAIEVRGEVLDAAVYALLPGDLGPAP